jgi:hypothetical protein
VADEPPERVEAQRGCRDHFGCAAATAEQEPEAGWPVFDDFMQRNFTAAAPNQVWQIGITEQRTAGESFTAAR